MTTAVATVRRRPAPITLISGSGLIAVLSMLTLTGIVAGIGRLFLGLGATTTLTDTYPWGIWIGFDFSLIAFSGAGFTLAAIAHVFRQHKYHMVALPAVLAGLLGYTAVLLLLVLDLGRPDRFYHFIIYLNLHSPLLEISWCVLLYTTVLVIENSPLVLKWLDGWRSSRLASHTAASGLFRIPLRIVDRLNWGRYGRLVTRVMTPVAIAGVTLSSLHQSTLGTLYLNMPHRLHPLWFSPILSLLFFVSSMMAGLGVATLAYMVAARIHGDEPKPDVLDGLATGMGVVTLLYVTLKFADWMAAGEIPMLLAFNRASVLMWIELGLGAILPMFLLFIPSIRSRPLARWVLPLLIVFGVFANRFNATLFAQILPPGAPAYTPHILEWLSTFGILAGAALAWYLAVRFLIPWQDEVHAGH